MANEEYLIHFTSFDTNYKKFEDRDGSGLTNLLGIIENGFKFNARKTYIPRPLDHTPGTELRMDMICFAEISSKDIVENKDKFGKFGICMKRSWVEKYSGQPVLYTFSSSFNNQILNRLNDLISKTYRVYLDTKDDRIHQVSLEIADLSNLLQALMEPMNHRSEKERRIINYPNNEILNRDLVTWHKEEEINNAVLTRLLHLTN